MRQSRWRRSKTPWSRAIGPLAGTIAVGIVALLTACTSEGQVGGGTGGRPGTATGGAPAMTGGASGTASGGATSTGGALSTGGATSTGGTVSTGGRAGTGGAPGAGGVTDGGVTDGGVSDARDAAATATGGAFGDAGDDRPVTGTGGRAGTGGSGGGCTESCATPPKSGVTVNCQKRFMTGVNFAWINFASDFGGGASGIAQTMSVARTQLQEMKANGVDVVRWWMHPYFTGGGVTFSNGSPTGLGGSELADINASLSLAAEVGVYLKLTLFSFDNFKPDAMSGHSLMPIIGDATRRKALIDNVVVPIARAVAASPNAGRMISWDVINEPEWAISGTDGLGDMAFDPNSALQTVTFSVMETFVREVVTALKAESNAAVTVGQAAIKWSRAFSRVGLDYYDMHYYGWVDQSFPIGGKTLADYGIGDKPVVVGEFPLQGWTNTNGTLTANQIMNKLWDQGYAGAKGWAFTQDGMWSSNKGNVATFASAKGCAVKY